MFLLGDNGRIVRRMFRIPTTTAKGLANAISPAFWSDEYAAMADFGEGYVQVFRMEDARKTQDGVLYSTPRHVSKVDIPDGGCCANVIWYS